MASPEFAEQMAAAMEGMRQIRRLQHEFAARLQQVMSVFELAAADDWEARYIAEGFQSLERAANGEEP